MGDNDEWKNMFQELTGYEKKNISLRINGIPASPMQIVQAHTMCEMDDSYIQKINEDANACFDGIIEFHTTLFHGLCAECIKKKNENK